MSNVTLGGKEYVVRPLPIRKAREWRAEMAGQFGVLADVLANADSIELTSPADIGRLVTVARDVLLATPDKLFDLLCSFVPEIAADRERIEAEAFDEEAITAFVEVLRLAFPFGALKSLIGRAAPTTSRS
jgi:hypothetical protein